MAEEEKEATETIGQQDEATSESEIEETAVGAEATSEEEPRVPGIFVPLGELDTRRVIELAMNLLSEQCWIRMGLVPDPKDGNTTKELSEAKLAIDTFALLLEQLRPGMDENEAKTFDGTLTNLRMNFVQQSK